ncbi:hypothetical protein [Aquimarina sp. SS2-1]|uniref:hypothetical protein n=1 Tax=Aquimarina besae TaxID=3342247 RepID=UPI00366E3578
MNKILLGLIITLTITSCNQKDKIKEELIQEIASLKTDEQKRLFLEEIYEKDQQTRKDVTEVEIKFGFESNERKEALLKAMKDDASNLKKIELYLEKYVYPSIAKQGERATRAPYIVIHHSGTIETKNKYFDYLYKAYKSGDLNPGSFSFYLERLHRMKFGKRFTLPNPYREKQLIDSLIKRLNLGLRSQ